METLKKIQFISQTHFTEIIDLLNIKYYLFKFLKLFKIQGGLFYEIDSKYLDYHLNFFLNYLEIDDFALLINKNTSFVEELVNSYLEQSFGNAIFTKLIYFFTIPAFDLNLRRFLILLNSFNFL